MLTTNISSIYYYSFSHFLGGGCGGVADEIYQFINEFTINRTSSGLHSSHIDKLKPTAGFPS